MPYTDIHIWTMIVLLYLFIIGGMTWAIWYILSTIKYLIERRYT